MPYNSVVGAATARLQSFTYADPDTTVWFDEAPLRDSAGAAVVPPHLVLFDEGTTPDYDTEYNPLEATKLRLELYAPSLAAVDAMASVVRYNGGAVNAGLGMDFAASFDFSAALALKACVRESEQRFQETGRGADAKPVFRCTMRYQVETQRKA